MRLPKPIHHSFVSMMIMVIAHSFVFSQAPRQQAATNHRIDHAFIANNVADIRITKGGTSWLILLADRNLSPINFFVQHHESFRLGPNDAMNLVKSTEDDIGFTHYRYEQLYKGVRVEGGEMLVHAPRLFIGDNSDEP